MTRITSFMMPKRQAHEASKFEDLQPGSTANDKGEDRTAKRKWEDQGDVARQGFKKRRGGGGADEEAGNKQGGEGGERKSGGGWGGREDIMRKAQKTEHRRLDRQDSRHSSTTCFACRSQGHAAKDCPNVLLAQRDDSALTTTNGNGEGEDQQQPRATGGMKRTKGKSGAEAAGHQGRCYRCNGGDHPLSRCTKPISLGIPYATCFICLLRGHLASTCPQNQGRGVYPNGGNCKVCGSTAHRAQDCSDDKRGSSKDKSNDNNVPGLTEEERMLLGEGNNLNRVGEIVLGMGESAGADEDDFMVAKRKRIAIDRGVAEREKKEKLARQVKKREEKKQTIGSMAEKNRDEGRDGKMEEGGEERKSNPLLEGNQMESTTHNPAPAVSVSRQAPTIRKKPKVVVF